MPAWRIDIVAESPLDGNFADPGRPRWDLAAALGDRGHSVRVLYPSTELSKTIRLRSAVGVAFPVVPGARDPLTQAQRVGSAASAAVDPSTDLVLIGGLSGGNLRPPGRQTAIAVFVEEVALEAYGRSLGPEMRTMGRRITEWMDRRALRKLEGAALDRASFILAAADSERDLLARHYPKVTAKVAVLPPGVPDPDSDVGDREAARRALQLPYDVPVAAYVDPDRNGTGRDAAIEAFRRVRLLFPGARLIVVGTKDSSDPGVSYVPSDDSGSARRAFRAADVVVVPSGGGAGARVALSAMRYGVATLLGPEARTADLTAGSALVSQAGTGESIAAELSELFADPALRRNVGKAGATLAEKHSFSRMAENLERLAAPAIAPANMRR